MSTVACSQCSTAVATANVLYTSDAFPVCAACYSKADIVETDKRHAKNIRNAAIASGGLGVLTFFSPLSGIGLVVIASAVAAMISGIYALRALHGDGERFTKHLTDGDRVVIWIGSIVGMTVAGLVALLFLSGMALLVR